MNQRNFFRTLIVSLIGLMWIVGCDNGNRGLLEQQNSLEVIKGSSVISIAGNSADGQQFAAGIPIQLTFSGEFSNGLRFTTEDEDSISDVVTWSVEGDPLATISSTGILRTALVAPGAVLTVTARGKAPYDHAEDNIEILISPASVIENSSLISIDGNSTDGQSFPVGVPVRFVFSVDFSDGFNFSTNNVETGNEFLIWDVKGSTEASITQQGILDTKNVLPGTRLTVSAHGVPPYESATDDIEVVVSDALLIEDSALVTIDGNPSDGQSFAAGLPVQLTFSAVFTDGFVYSNTSRQHDVNDMSWEVVGDSKATIDSEGVLTTKEVVPGTTLTVIAKGNAPYESATDSIRIIISHSVVVDGSAEISINGNSSNNQVFPVGVPIPLTFSALLSNGLVYSTDNEGRQTATNWQVTGASGATISSEGVLNTAGVQPGSTLVVTAKGKEPYESATDTIEVSLSEAIVVGSSALVSISGNSANGQTFPAGIPIQLTFSAEFSNGDVYSTDDNDSDGDVMNWSGVGESGATISSEGILNTANVEPGTTLRVVAVGKVPYQDAKDSIDIMISDAVLVENSGLLSINGNSADGQIFPSGVPIPLEFTASFSDGFTYSTQKDDHKIDVLNWKVEGDDSAFITPEGVLNTTSVLPGVSLKITANGKIPYQEASDTIEVSVSDAVIIDSSGVISIAGNSADGQVYPAGIPLHLEFSAQFTDGHVYSSTQGDHHNLIDWTITKGSGASISSTGMLNTAGVEPGTSIVVTANGREPYTSMVDTIKIDVSEAVPIETSAQVSIAGNGVDGQSFPAGIPVPLTFSVQFSDGYTYSSENRSDDNTFVSWSGVGESGAIIDSEGILDTSGVEPGTTLRVVAMGKAPYDGLSDSIELLVSEAELLENTSIITIAGESSDGQTFPAGVPVKLTFSTEFSDGYIYSTDYGTDDSRFIRWSVAPGLGATISTEGLIDTKGVSPGTNLVVTATGQIPWAHGTDTIELVIEEAELVEGSANVLINGDSADGQTFPAGVPVPLVFKASFSNGFEYSTDNGFTDNSFMTWMLGADSGATISSEGVLSTANVQPGTKVLVTATGKSPYQQAKDDIEVVITEAVLTELTIDTSPVVPLGLTTNVKVNALYSDGNSYEVTNRSIIKTNSLNLKLEGDGTLRGIKYGSAEIEAYYLGKEAKSLVTVNSGVCGHDPKQEIGTQLGGGVNDTEDNAKGSSCLKVAIGSYQGQQKYFTGPPSEEFVNAIGLFRIDNTSNNDGYSVARFYGPPEHPNNRFANFRADGRNVSYPSFKNSQSDRWCQVLSESSFMGKQTWKTATRQELEQLIGGRHMPNEFNWAAGHNWTTTACTNNLGQGFWAVNNRGSNPVASCYRYAVRDAYSSCVSE